MRAQKINSTAANASVVGVISPVGAFVRGTPSPPRASKQDAIFPIARVFIPMALFLGVSSAIL
jgi:hypothetical protein